MSLDCKDRLTELSSVEMCIQGMHWELLYILKGIKPRTFEELATRAHDMELSIASRENQDILIPNMRKEGRNDEETIEESMVVNITLPKLSSKEKRQTNGAHHLTLKERQKKIYPFPDADIPDMLEQLLEAQLIEFPKCKRPEEMEKVDDPKFCKYHRVIDHPVERCFVLKELILKLAMEGKICWVLCPKTRR